MSLRGWAKYLLTGESDISLDSNHTHIAIGCRCVDCMQSHVEHDRVKDEYLQEYKALIKERKDRERE
jgi:hypothetical protein